MERYTMFFEWKNQYCQNDCTTQGNLQGHLIGGPMLGPETGVTERLLHIFQHRTSPINSP